MELSVIDRDNFLSRMVGGIYGAYFEICRQETIRDAIIAENKMKYDQAFAEWRYRNE
jgi:hypothetical protein